MRLWYWFFQNFVVWPVTWTLLHFFYRIEIRGLENVRNLAGPLIIAANHKTLFDGFLIGVVLPWGARFKLFPLRFMIENLRFRGKVLEFLRKLGLMSLFSFLVGGFPSGRGEGIENAIKIPLGILEKRIAPAYLP